ncbi:type II CAAX endopeptidase family protein [Halorubrum sp. AD140]|uniref:CPBP family intramembrane glutamic endopeptidase n=1 Tax=Halorubrum sp. AD140 TaxID=3050073 RepID=UPI002ACCC183|nr:type II CAAX endopeptidase family protein [Halorubrum sp. AD140]MDZ5809884.1 type II CAAX endopeptidase family protein [Halorubrum sp. AD140]
MTDDLPVPVDRLVHVASAAFALVLSLLVASLIAQLATSAAVGVGVVAPETNAFALLQTVATFAGFLPAVVGYLVITDQRDLVSVSLPSLREAGIIGVAAVALYALQIGLLLALREFGLRTGQNPATAAAGDPVTYYAAMIAVSLFVVGPAEELLLRGVVQGGLRRSFDAAPAILVAALAFGALHGNIEGTAAEQVAYMGVTVVLGAILGALYERTENVLVPGLAHGLYNAIIFAGLLWGAL